MRFTGVCLVTQDVPRLVAFYRKVLRLPHEEGNVFEIIPVEGAMLSIYTADGMEKMAPGSLKDAGFGSYTLEFEVEDVDSEHERLVAEGVEIVKPPTTQSWGRRSVWFRDPDGNVVNFHMSVEG
jgi:catechol 2,3-dioxygenase-like lactoylglutathione lyase family enzyme